MHESADPLFRFVRKGKVGYIDAAGKVAIQPTLPNDTFAGEFHEGLLGVKEGSSYTFVDHTIYRSCNNNAIQ